MQGVALSLAQRNSIQNSNSEYQPFQTQLGCNPKISQLKKLMAKDDCENVVKNVSQYEKMRYEEKEVMCVRLSF